MLADWWVGDGGSRREPGSFISALFHSHPSPRSTWAEARNQYNPETLADAGLLAQSSSGPVWPGKVASVCRNQTERDTEAEHRASLGLQAPFQMEREEHHGISR